MTVTICLSLCLFALLGAGDVTTRDLAEERLLTDVLTPSAPSPAYDDADGFGICGNPQTMALIIDRMRQLYGLRFLGIAVDCVLCAWCPQDVLPSLLVRVPAALRFIILHSGPLCIAGFAVVYNLQEVFVRSEDQSHTFTYRDDVFWRLLLAEYAVLYACLLWRACLKHLKIFGGKFDFHELRQPEYQVATSSTLRDARVAQRVSLDCIVDDPALTVSEYDSAKAVLYPKNVWQTLGICLFPVLTIGEKLPGAPTEGMLQYVLRQEIGLAVLTMFLIAVESKHCIAMTSSSYLFGLPFCLSLVGGLLARLSAALGRTLGFCQTNPEWQVVFFNGMMTVKRLILIVCMVPCAVIYRHGYLLLSIVVLVLEWIVVELCIGLAPATCTKWFTESAEELLKKLPALPH